MKTWHQVQQAIIDGLQSPAGTVTHDVALQRLARMTAICEYFRNQEEQGDAGWAESALHPKSAESVSTL